MNPSARPSSSSAIRATPSSTVSERSSHASSHVSRWYARGRARLRTPPRARGSGRGRFRWRGGSSLVAKSEQEEVGAQVLERVEPGTRGTDVRLVRVEREHSLAQAEVTRRPGVRPRQVAREEPVGAPFSEPAQRGQARFHLVVRQDAERVEIDVRARDAENILGLPAREAERGQLFLACACDTFARRKRVCELRAFAEALDEPAPNRERGVERHLLRGDRRYERFERIRRERRAKAGETMERLGEDGLTLGKTVELFQVELQTHELADDRLDVCVERLGVDSSSRRRDANLAAMDNAVQSALVPDVRAIDAPVREPIE